MAVPPRTHTHEDVYQIQHSTKSWQVVQHTYICTQDACSQILPQTTVHKRGNVLLPVLVMWINPTCFRAILCAFVNTSPFSSQVVLCNALSKREKIKMKFWCINVSSVANNTVWEDVVKTTVMWDRGFPRRCQNNCNILSCEESNLVCSVCLLVELCVVLEV